MTGEPARTRRAHLGMLLWAALVGLSFPAVGVLSDALPPLHLTALRFAIAAVALWPLVCRERIRLPTTPGVALYALLGLCLAVFFGAMFWAAHRSTALSMATLYVSVPLLAYGFGRLLAVERKAGRLPVILAVGATGALGLALAEHGLSVHNLRFGAGEAVFFLGCIASALYPVLSKFGLARGWLAPSAAQRTFWSLLAGCVIVGVLGVALEPSSALRHMTALDGLLIVYLGVFSSAMTFWLLQGATNTLTPGPVTAYSYLVPFVSMILLFVDEPGAAGWQWLPGSLLVLWTITALLRRDTSATNATDTPPSVEGLNRGG